MSVLHRLLTGWFTVCVCVFSTPEPTFVYMAQMPEDETNQENDDKVYLFFNENALGQCEFYQKVAVPRVARVCKVTRAFCLFTNCATYHKRVDVPFRNVQLRYGFQGDLGGRKILYKKWTTFLKATLDCPVPRSPLPYIIQDAYLWCDPKLHWRNCLFYVIFTSQMYRSS